MKSFVRHFSVVAGVFTVLSAILSAQTNTFPSSGDAGIGTLTPAFKLDVVGDVHASGQLIEKRVVFTPTAVGWYRIVAAGAQAGGTIRTSGAYDGGTTATEFSFSIRGWGQGGTITLLKNSGVNGNLIDQARVSSDGGGSVYLDVRVSTATVPSPITIYGYGPGLPDFVGNPVVGATAGSSSVRMLPIGYSWVHTTTFGPRGMSLPTPRMDGLLKAIFIMALRVRPLSETAS